MSQVRIKQRRRKEAMPVLHGMEGRARTWNDDAVAAVATTTIAALSLLSLDHRSLDRRCRHSSPSDPLRCIPSSAHNDEEEAIPPRFAFDCRFIPTPLSSLHRCPRGLMNTARAQRRIPRIHPSTPVDTQRRGAPYPSSLSLIFPGRLQRTTAARKE